MKNLALLFTLILSHSALSGELEVFNQPVFNMDVISSNFQINKELGRAWVEISLDDSTFSDTDDYQTLRVKVPGLSFNQEQSTIELLHEGQLIECAKVKVVGKSIFKRTVIKNTSCDLVSMINYVDYDDGFEIKKRRHAQLILKY